MAASEDVKNTYGREHIDKMKSMMSPIEIPVESPDPVLDAIEDALLNVNPRPRYIVPGYSGWFIDHHAVSTTFVQMFKMMCTSLISSYGKCSQF